jgi:SAM-dependent methyltransferase
MTDQAGLLREAWNAHAREWIEWVRAPGWPDSYWRFHRDEFLTLVPKTSNLTVDIGCGEGRVGRDLVEHGHKQVFGIDCSLIMCHAAADHPKAAPAVVADAVRLPLADASVDCAVAFLSLQDIDDMPGAVKEAARILKDGKKLILSIVHPMYSGGGFWETGTDDDKLFVIKPSYFEPELCVSTDQHDDLTMTFHREHRPIQAYTKALTDVGFTIEELREVTDPDTSDPRHGIPMFLAIAATRRRREQPAVPQREPGTVGTGAVNGWRNHRARIGLIGAARPNGHPPRQASQDQLQPVPTAPETPWNGARYRRSWFLLSLMGLLQRLKG